MEIILIRHGKAEGQKKASEDKNRPLTDKGKEGIEGIIPSIIESINGEKNTIIWSSPAVRADETAKIIAKGLGVEKVIHFDFIWNGSFNALIERLRTIEENIQIIIVGHEPYLGKWSKKLTGKEIYFKKGMMACININTLEPVSAEFMWKEKPETKRNKIEKKHKPGLTVKEFKLILLELIDDLLELQKQYSDHSDNIELVHDIRVKIRQTRSFISLTKQMWDSEEYNYYQKKLQEIARTFSYLRELDVIYAQWSHILENNEELKDNSSILNMLKDERENEILKVNEYVTGNQMTVELGEISSWIEGWKEVYSEDEKLTKHAVAVFEDWNKSIAKDISSVKYDDISEVHKLRLLFKKVRYVQSRIGFLAKKQQYSTAKMKKKQDYLGMFCDIYNNIAIIEKLNSVYVTEDLQFEKGIFIGYLLCQKEMIVNGIKLK